MLPRHGQIIRKKTEIISSNQPQHKSKLHNSNTCGNNGTEDWKFGKRFQLKKTCLRKSLPSPKSLILHPLSNYRSALNPPLD